jgi:hypothetical protein
MRKQLSLSGKDIDDLYHTKEKFITDKTIFSTLEERDNESYEIVDVENKIVHQFSDLLSELEREEDMLLCMRGDSKKSVQEHDDFFRDTLDKIFIVGQKARYFSYDNEKIKEIHQHIQNHDKNTLINEIEVLNDKVNSAIKIREKEFSKNIDEYKKCFTFINDLKLTQYDKKTLWGMKIFLLHFLHTDGREKEFNTQTPFLSTAYGDEKFEIAKKFALGEDRQNKKSYIAIYLLNTKNAYYYKTKDLSGKLQSDGCKWHEDKYDELILVNGMFPHYLLALLELEKEEVTRCILNPVLYDILKTKSSLDIKNGLPINQEDFLEYAQALGYSQYWVKHPSNKVDVKNMQNDESEEVISSF